MCERLFSDRKGKNSLFTNEEKLELAELVSKRKEEYDAEVARNVGKFKYILKFQPLPPYYSSPPPIINIY